MKMKTRTKQCGVFAVLAAALLLLAALVITCVDPIGPEGLTAPQKEELEPFVPPEGMGYFRLNVDVEKFGARTIFPTRTYNTVASFDTRAVYITGGDSSGGNYNKPSWNGTDPIAVNTSGTPYVVTVVGFNDDGVAVAAGTGTVTVSTPVSGSPATGGEEVSIVMKEITSGTYVGNGTLTLALDNTDTAVTTATANVIGLSANTTDTYETTNTNVLPGAAGAVNSFSLAPGYYQLELTLAKTGFATAIYRELVVIWSGMPSAYVTTLTLYSNQHTVTYNPHGGTIIAATKQFTHGDPLTNPGTTPTAPTYAGYTFDGWYTKDGTPAGDPPAPDWGTLFILGTTRVLKSQTVHAKWEVDTTPPPNSQITWDVTINYSTDNVKTLTVALFDPPLSDPLPDPLPTALSPPYAFSQATPPHITFMVSGATLTAPLTYSWTYQGSGTVLSTADTLTIDFADSANWIYLNAGVPQVFRVRVGDAVPGFYEATVTITVNP